MIRTTTARRIACPRDRLFALFADEQRWPTIFPLVQGVRLVADEGTTKRIEVEHAEGRVPNLLRLRPPDVIELEERKRRFDARFVHRFEADGNGTRLVVDAEVRLRGLLRWLEPFVAMVVRRKLQRYTLAPLQRWAEARRDEHRRG